MIIDLFKYKTQLKYNLFSVHIKHLECKMHLYTLRYLTMHHHPYSDKFLLPIHLVLATVLAIAQI